MNLRKLAFERLEERLTLAAQSWNMAADFAADFVNGLPQHNPNGVWKYYATDGSTASLVATNGSNPNTFGVGAGWAESDGVPSYARGGAFGFPSNTLAGHGPNKIVWAAPAEMDFGGVQITGLFTQAPFEPSRQMELRIYKNDFFTPLITVDVNFQVQNTIIPLPSTQVSMKPGDTLTILIDGSGPLGNGISTFTASNVVIQEIQLPGDYNYNGVVDAADYAIWRETLGSTTQLAADGNGNGMVDPTDYQFWRSHFGNAFDPGGMPLVYHPAAIVVQTSGVTLPDGSALDIGGSQTQGLQEAINYSAQQGWDVFVLPGTYTLNAHLDFAALQLRTFRFEDVILNFTSNVTDFGIRFDSTMLTNWYWKGGAINAPNAASGILYQPRTPHPLDGIKYGTIGVVDSYFHFNVDIAAGTYKVTMNTQQATINDLTFYFKNVPRNEIHYVGGGFAAYNIFEDPRTDDPSPFDIFSTAGRVTVVPPLTDISDGLPGTVFLPDGSRLDVFGTQTFGLQEAFNYAAGHNLDVLVFGRGVRNVSPFTGLGLYNLSAPLVVSDLVDRLYRIYGVTFNYTIGGDTLQLGDITNSTFELTGQVVSTVSSNAVLIRPNGPGVIGSSVRIQATVGGTGTADTLVRLDPSLASFQNNLLYFHEINTGGYGIKIVNPSPTTVFTNNLVRTLHTHAIAGVGVQVAQNSTNAERINNNTVQVRTNTDGFSGYAALQVFSDYNTFDIYAGNSGLTYGARFEPSSNNNVSYVGYLQATTPLVNLGVNNVFLPQPASSSALPGTGSAAGMDYYFAPTTSGANGSSALGAQAAAPPPNDEALLVLVPSAGRSNAPPLDPDTVADTAFALDEDQHEAQFNFSGIDEAVFAQYALLHTL
jgi:hypothetical protein